MELVAKTFLFLTDEISERFDSTKSVSFSVSGRCDSRVSWERGSAGEEGVELGDRVLHVLELRKLQRLLEL